MTTFTLDRTNRTFDSGATAGAELPTAATPAWAADFNNFFERGNVVEIERRDGTVVRLDRAAIMRIYGRGDNQALREEEFRAIVGPNADYQDFKRLVDDVMVGRPDAHDTVFRLGAAESRRSGVVDETESGRSHARSYGGPRLTLDERPAPADHQSATHYRLAASSRSGRGDGPAP